MEPQPYKDWISGIFDRSSEIYGQKYNTFFDYFAKKLVALAGLRAGAHVLDVATGRGAILKEAAEAVGPKGNVVGIDISSEMIRLTSEALRRYKNIQLKRMDAENLDLEDASFDYVFCGFAIFFFPNLDKVFLEFMRVLKPGGKICISTWGEGDYHYQIFHSIYKNFGYDVTLFMHNFTDNARLPKLLAESGFAQIETTSDDLDFIYPTFDDWFNSIWAGVGRGVLEKCTPEQLEELKSALAAKLAFHFQPDGLHERLRANYACAVKPVA